VIDAKGQLVGKVKDIAFAVGKTGISLSVENEDGELQNIPWEDVQAASDFIIIKPVPQRTYEPQKQQQQHPVQPVVQEQSTQPLCPTCNQPLTWIPKYKKWYCYNDKKYVSVGKKRFLGLMNTSSNPKQSSTQQLCPTCNQPLTWIPQYKRWYCYND